MFKMKTHDVIEYDEAGRYLIVTDGILTETSYFERVKQLTRDVIIIKRVKHYGDLVSQASKIGGAGKFDKVFIVCDIDEHCKNEKSRLAFEELMRSAEVSGIEVICSHECFEVWLLAHKSQVPAEAKDRKAAQKLAKDAGLLKGGNAKTVVDTEITPESIKHASQEAKRLRKTYGSSILDDGPATDVDRLIDIVRI